MPLKAEDLPSEPRTSPLLSPGSKNGGSVTFTVQAGTGRVFSRETDELLRKHLRC